MSQQANITVFDGASTPVLHTLLPADNKVDPKGARVAVWREAVSSLPTEAQVSATMFQRVHPSMVVETRMRVSVPVMESIGSQNAAGYTAAPKVAYVDTADVVVYSHPRSTIGGRNLALQALRNLLTNTSTTVTPVTAGVVYEGLVGQFMPT